jgi:hypothetical protein
VAIGVKSAERWERADHAGLLRFRELHPDKPVALLGVYRGRRALREDGVRVLPAAEFLRLLGAGEIAGDSP